MEKMKRRTLHLSDQDKVMLSETARKFGVSQADILRQGIRLVYEKGLQPINV